MKGAISDRRAMIAGMSPMLHEAEVAYATVAALPFPPDDPRLIALIREVEGLTLILPHREAEALGLTVVFRAAQITRMVRSPLEGVAPTAAVALALGQAGIACNVVAGARHDHLFVPWGQRDAAMEALARVARDA